MIVGNPTVANANVTATVVEGKNRKVVVYRYKAKKDITRKKVITAIPKLRLKRSMHSNGII